MNLQFWAMYSAALTFIGCVLGAVWLLERTPRWIRRALVRRELRLMGVRR
jgi:hypothetical protein